jgi:1-acyl-sn-glycerol-3-phosphate acyltransferase
MADPSALAEQARQDGKGEGLNGAGEGPARGRLGSLARVAGRLAEETGGALAPLVESMGRAAGGAASAVSERVGDRLTADLDDRDPDYIREKLPLAWLVSSIWFRAEVRNLGNVPEDRSVLLVGNHSGGNMTPDTTVFTLAFSTYFGIERPFYQLAHNLVLASPYGQILRRFGTVSASHENAARALDAGAALLVYPGGDWEVHRPTWERHKVDFADRSGFVRLALDADVPIVPVVAVGGQETALFLDRGAWLARAFGLDRLLRLKVMPVSIALPWGLNVGDFLGHLPLPAKITIEVLPPIDLREQFGAEPDPAEVREHVVRAMQDTLDALAAERRYPIVG